MNYIEEAASMLPETILLRRDFHMYPDVSKEEFRTAEVITKYLQELGLEVRTDYANELPSVVGVLKGRRTGKTVALRADMDALHIEEKNDVPYCSTIKGVMHACGHDCHCATLMGAAAILVKHKNELNGNVKFIFEPAEEDIGGAKYMIDNGVLDDVDAIFGLHCENKYPVGAICTCAGEMQAASDRLIIKIKGKAAHGALPHLGVDAVTIACHFVLSVQTMMAREKDAFQHAIITFGQINGGTARNIVCNEVTLNGICRCLNSKTREFLNSRIEGLLKGIVSAFGGTYELERQRSHPALYSDPQLTEFVNTCAVGIVGKNNIHTMPHAFLGCESFAYFAEKRPAAFFFLGTGNEKQHITAPLHSNNFDVDENSLIYGTAMHVAIVDRYLNGNILGNVL